MFSVVHTALQTEIAYRHVKHVRYDHIHLILDAPSCRTANGVPLTNYVHLTFKYLNICLLSLLSFIIIIIINIIRMAQSDR